MGLLLPERSPEEETTSFSKRESISDKRVIAGVRSPPSKRLAEEVSGFCEEKKEGSDPNAALAATFACVEGVDGRAEKAATFPLPIAMMLPV